jgi:hypothetical protein
MKSAGRAAKAKFTLQHFIEPLDRRPGFATRPMFGCLAIYLDQLNVLILAEKAGTKEWNGLLVPTDRPNHASLRAEFPALESHPVIGKWLYVPQSHENFEATIEGIVARVGRGDPRIGVESKPKRRKAKTTKARTPARARAATRKSTAKRKPRPEARAPKRAGKIPLK